MTDTIDRSDQSSASTPHDAEVIDRLVVRFAGDSGDGMQLTGDRFTSVSALVRQRPVDAARLPGRDPRPSRHGQRRVQLPGPHLRPRHHHAGRRAQRAGGDEPGGAEGRPRPARAGRHADRQRATRSTSATSRRPSYDTNPLEDGTRRAATGVIEVPMTSLTKDALRAARREAPRRRALQELLRARAGLVDVHPAGRADARLDRRAVRQERAGHGRQHGRLQGRLHFGETTELFDHPLRGRARPSCPPASTPTSPATRRSPGASSPPVSWPSCRCSSAATRSRRPPTSSTSCRSTSTSASARSRPKTRSRRRHGARRGVRRPPRHHHDERSRPVAEERDDQPGGRRSSCRC